MDFKYERTSPDFPTYGPADTGESWGEYMKRIKMAENYDDLVADDEEDDEDADVGLPDLLVQPHEVLPSECPNPLRAYAKLLESNLWAYKMGHSQTFTKGVPYKGGAKAGQMRDDKTIDHYWVSAHKEGKGLLSVSYEVVNGKVAPYNRNINRRLRVVPDAEMKAWIKS